MRTRFSLSQFIVILVCVDTSAVIFQSNQRTVEYKWEVKGNLSSCSTTCGTGIQKKNIVCLRMGLSSEAIVTDDFCKSLSKPKEIIKVCNAGECGRIYYWKVSNWSECSETCGNAGRKSRDIECLFDKGNESFIARNKDYCNSANRPETFSTCNLIDCPPVFIMGKWNRCIASQGCLPGKQRRSLDCISLLKTGKIMKVKPHACYKKGLPPSSWRKCYDHINTKICLQSNKQLPKIEKKINTIVQMRKIKKLKIQIGQVAHVLLYTTVLLRCPVNYFVPKDLLWKHNNIIYKFNGETKNRIKVDKKGRIRISKFKTEDQGQWICIAGNINASSIIKYRKPSLGYEDWVLRTALWKREIFDDDLKLKIVKQVIVQWIKGAWSKCSISCGGTGIQHRRVHCEEIDTRYYNILNAKICEKKGHKKPDIQKICHRTSKCPQWLLTGEDNSKCTDKCLRIGVAKTMNNVSCIFQEKKIDEKFCDKAMRPSNDCPNENCQVSWRVSKWSKCSITCGERGIMGRYLTCIWKNTNQSAGSLCYHQGIPTPRVIKTCTVPVCHLKCVDLSPSCHKREKYCKLPIYSFICCNSCKMVYRQMINFFNERNLLQGREMNTDKKVEHFEITNRRNAYDNITSIKLNSKALLYRLNKKDETNNTLYSSYTTNNNDTFIIL